MPPKEVALDVEATSSQADTEPLSFEDDEEEEEQNERKMNEDSEEAMRDVDSNAVSAIDAQMSVGDDSAEAQDALTALANSASAVNDTFSDGSDLTDESDESELDADGDGDDEDDDDEMGGDEDEDDDDEDEMGADDDDDEEDADAEADEDEAVAGLAALTSAGDAVDNGLDGLAALAAAGAGNADQDEDRVDSDAESTASSQVASLKARRGRLTAKPRLGSRLNEVVVASEQASEQDKDSDDGDDDEDAEDAKDDEQQSQGKGSRAKRSRNNTRDMSSLGSLASAAKKSTGRVGAAAGLLAGAPAITIEEAGSGAPSVSSSREGSPRAEDEEEQIEAKIADATEDDEGTVKDDAEKDAPTPSQQELEGEIAAEEDATTDEAAIKRQEAMDALTKIEISFAVLRDRLYVERMDEISKESEMILEGTHPDLIYLTNFIEARRERRLNLVEKWFDHQQSQYERVARAEEAAVWSNWRNEVVQLRQKQLDDVSRKRRKLDREKRALDGPRPARRHQVFETELVRNPDFDAMQKLHGRGKRNVDPRIQEMEDLEEMGAYVAYPDLRAAEEAEAWADIERIGIQPDVRMVPSMGYYRPGEPVLDPYTGQNGESLPSFGNAVSQNGMQGDRLHAGPEFDGRRPPAQAPGMIDAYDQGPPGIEARMHLGKNALMSPTKRLKSGQGSTANGSRKSEGAKRVSPPLPSQGIPRMDDAGRRPPQIASGRPLGADGGIGAYGSRPPAGGPGSGVDNQAGYPGPTGMHARPPPGNLAAGYEGGRVEPMYNA